MKATLVAVVAAISLLGVAPVAGAADAGGDPGARVSSRTPQPRTWGCLGASRGPAVARTRQVPGRACSNPRVWG